MTPDGVGEVTDFMPVAGSRATGHHRLVRLVRVVRGTMRFVVDIKPRFDYGRQPHKLEITDEGAIFHTDDLELTLHSVGRAVAPRGATCGAELERIGDDLRMHRHPEGRRERRDGAGVRRAAARGGCRTAPWSACPARPPSSGAPGCASPPTPGAGGRWSPARR